MKKLFTSFKLVSALLVFSTILFAFTNKFESPVSFLIVASVNANVNTGTFTSTGFAMSSGVLVEEYSFNGKKTHSEVTFTDVAGSVTAKTHTDVILTSASTATGTGTWIIIRGSGAYVGVKGSGTLTFNVTDISTPTENILEQWVGSIKR